MNEDAVMKIKVLSYLDSRKQPFTAKFNLLLLPQKVKVKKENEMLFSHFHEYDYHNSQSWLLSYETGNSPILLLGDSVHQYS